jgi:hypothetical protein
VHGEGERCAKEFFGGSPGRGETAGQPLISGTTSASMTTCISRSHSPHSSTRTLLGGAAGRGRRERRGSDAQHPKSPLPPRSARLGRPRAAPPLPCNPEERGLEVDAVVVLKDDDAMRRGVGDAGMSRREGGGEGTSRGAFFPVRSAKDVDDRRVSVTIRVHRCVDKSNICTCCTTLRNRRHRGPPPPLCHHTGRGQHSMPGADANLGCAARSPRPPNFLMRGGVGGVLVRTRGNRRAG